ncbi:ADF-H domain profile [ [Octopus vulgaris]|uniref:ADF-H domain profile n=1 Tax=Octopus vulgaris TaxID=6645 RepID=A0AA36AI91_OCTVU|nr:ADF-H domain profile [ [Octopus vulgaris]
MSSGIIVSQQVIDLFHDIKSKKKIRYCILDLNDTETALVPGECVLKPEPVDVSLCAVKKEWESFCSKLTLNDCLYIIYDMNYQRPGGARRDKLLLISWCPESSSTRKKMIYTSTLNTLKSALAGIQVEVQSNDLGDLDFEEVLQKVDKS